ncbi:hypothetical protein [Paenibacillus rhizoplanae]
MKFPDSAGILLTVSGLIKDEEIIIQSIDNYHYPFKDFIKNSQTNNLVRNKVDEVTNVPKIYIIAGHKDKISRIKNVWNEKTRQAINRILRQKNILKIIEQEIQKIEYCSLEMMHWLYLYDIIENDHIKYPRGMTYGTEGGDLEVLVFYWTNNPKYDSKEELNHTILFWLERERPFLKGMQCVIYSFILRNMVGRKVLATIPDVYGNWGMLLEGGVFLPLADDFESGMSKINSTHVGKWTVGEIEEIALNPTYGFGVYFDNIELFSEWFYVFLYAMATIDDKELDPMNVRLLYGKFLEYIGKNICPYEVIKQKIIEEEEALEVLVLTLCSIREYLKGEEDTGISKNILLMMRSRNAYLPIVTQFIRKNSNLVVPIPQPSIPLDYNYWKENLYQLASVPTAYEKGVEFEELVQYFIRTIPGIKITGIREKRGRAEVDIYCCNVSFDALLWKLGALILIECK